MDNKKYIFFSLLLPFMITSCMEIEYHKGVTKNPDVSLTANAIDITINSAILVGNIDGDMGDYRDVLCYFYVTTSEEDTPSSNSSAKRYYCGENDFKVELSDLEIGTTYYYLFVAEVYDAYSKEIIYTSPEYEFTTLTSISDYISGLWIEDNSFSKEGNMSFEFKPYKTVVQRQFDFNTKASFIGSGTYSVSNDKYQISATIGGRQTTYVVSNCTNTSMTLTDFRDNSYTLTKVDNSISADYAKPVDLGLPSGTLWSDCNLGAFSPDDLGGRYAWGETVEKEEYTSGSYLYYDVNIGTYINSTQYDAAYRMSEKWEIPTFEQCKELLTKCTFSYENGLVKATGPNGNSIYLPEKYYWTATENSNYDYQANSMNMADVESTYRTVKYYGYYIRPVYKK